MSNVYEFPGKKQEVKSCSSCEHVMLGNYGMYCGFYQEELHMDAALECEEYVSWETGK